MLYRGMRILALIALSVFSSVYMIQAGEHGGKIVSALSDLSTQLGLLSHEIELSMVATRLSGVLSPVHASDVIETNKLAQQAHDDTIKRASGLADKRNVSLKLAAKPYVKDTALIVVDVQYDFLEQFVPGTEHNGSLAVDNTGEKYTNAVKDFVEVWRNTGCLIVFTQDYHPKGHVSFKSRWEHQTTVPLHRDPETKLWFINSPYTHRKQILWPDHCVQSTAGAIIGIPFQVNEDLRVHKGMRFNFDSYSGFEDDGGEKTGLEGALDILGIKNLIIIGIATDVCVKATVKHALELHKYNVYVITNLCRGVNAADSSLAFTTMQSEGAHLISLITGPRDAITEALKYSARKQKKLIEDLTLEKILAKLKSKHAADIAAAEGGLSS